ncbi:MAG TPA: hypothetical protein VMD53_17090 [Rhizomicrobium sp.]|nr:hypothetical protein [Rhizomicrobium sp.]
MVSKMDVYQFEVRDHATGAMKLAAHMATRAFIETAKGTIVEGSRRAVDSALVDANGKADISVQPGHSSQKR